MKVLIIDATHGGLTLSEAFSERGDIVTCVDIYKTLKVSEHEKCSKEFEIRSDLPSTLELSNYDLIVRPVHFPSSPFAGFKGKIITHHEAVKMLAYDKVRFPVVEVTGSFGKTTAVKCAVALLRGQYSILTLTSDGIRFTKGANEQILLEGVSTTPANIIKALRFSPRDPDLAIFEVSLGGTGMADLGILKNVYNNYPIARGSSSALMAKMSMVRQRKPNSKVLLNADDPLLRGIRDVQYFSSCSLPCEVSAGNVCIGAGYIKFTANFRNFITFKGPVDSRVLVEAYNGPFGRQNLENMLVGVSIAKFFGVSEDTVEIPPNVFSKKMVLDNSGPLILNRSPAINEKSVERAIKDYLEVLPPVRLEIGGRLKTTCGPVNLSELATVINSSPFKEVYLFGELGESLRPMILKDLSEELIQPAKVPTLRLERG